MEPRPGYVSGYGRQRRRRSLVKLGEDLAEWFASDAGGDLFIGLRHVGHELRSVGQHPVPESLLVNGDDRRNRLAVLGDNCRSS